MKVHRGAFGEIVMMMIFPLLQGLGRPPIYVAAAGGDGDGGGGGGVVGVVGL